MKRKLPTAQKVGALLPEVPNARTSDKPVVKKGQGLQGNRKATGSPVNY